MTSPRSKHETPRSLSNENSLKNHSDRGVCKLYQTRVFLHSRHPVFSCSCHFGRFSEYEFQISIQVEIIGNCSLYQAECNSSGSRSFWSICKQEVFPVDHKRLNTAFREIVADLKAPVVQISSYGSCCANTVSLCRYSCILQYAVSTHSVPRSILKSIDEDGWVLKTDICQEFRIPGEVILSRWIPNGHINEAYYVAVYDGKEAVWVF